MQNYWGFVMSNSLRNPGFLQNFKILKSGSYPMFNFGVREAWGVNLVEVEFERLQALIPELQALMNPEPEWFAHFFRDYELVVVYRQRTYTMSVARKETWVEALEYGHQLGIPALELDFVPNTTETARKWFRRMRVG